MSRHRNAKSKRGFRAYRDHLECKKQQKQSAKPAVKIKSVAANHRAQLAALFWILQCSHSDAKPIRSCSPNTDTDKTREQRARRPIPKTQSAIVILLQNAENFTNYAFSLQRRPTKPTDPCFHTVGRRHGAFSEIIQFTMSFGAFLRALHSTSTSTSISIHSPPSILHHPQHRHPQQPMPYDLQSTVYTIDDHFDIRHLIRSPPRPLISEDLWAQSLWLSLEWRWWWSS